MVRPAVLMVASPAWMQCWKQQGPPQQHMHCEVSWPMMTPMIVMPANFRSDRMAASDMYACTLDMPT